METNGCNLSDSARTHFSGLGYRYLGEEHPDFGGIVFYLQQEGGEEEAAYYISKPSAIELVTSDELRHILDFLEESGIRLRHIVTTSPLSYASREMTGKNEIQLWKLQSQCVEIVRPTVDRTDLKRLLFHLGMLLANSASRSK